MLLCEARKGTKKTNEKKKKKKKVGALIAHVDWIPFALTKMRIKSQN
jgi:hypothetical protein